MAAASIPTVGKVRLPRVPTVSDHTLSNGLRVMAVRRAGVPRFEARLRIPVARKRDAANPGLNRMLAETAMAGTTQRSSFELAQALQALGASLDAGVDADEAVFSLSGLVTNMAKAFDLLAEVLTAANFPDDEVVLERDRLAQEAVIVRSQPSSIASEAFHRRLYADHPYGRVLAEPKSIARLTRAELRNWYAKRVVPAGSTLVVVGDVRPGSLFDVLEGSLSGWARTGSGGALPLAKPPRSGPIALVDRPGAVQTNIRIGGPAISRRDADYPALALANTVFGGYFSSRLTENLRERRGYTYSPRSGISQGPAASHFSVGADVATQVTAPAIAETRYELSRMALLPVEADELDAARRYVQGSTALGTQTQAGLASYMSTLASFGLDLGYLRDLPARLEKVTIDDVLSISAKYLAPRGLITILVGDAERIRPSVEALDDVELLTV